MKDKNLTRCYNNDFQTRYGIAIDINELHECTPHSHDFYEFEYILDGESLCSINGKAYPVKQGDIIFSSPTCIHSYEYSDKKLKLFALHLNIGILKNFAELSQIDSCVLPDMFKMKDMFYELYSLWDIFDKYSYPAILNAAERIVIHFLRQKNITEGNNPSSNINFAKSYIMNHFRENITIDSISSKLGYSPSYCSRWFKEKLGCGYSEYLTEIRLEYARSVLEVSQISICDLCFECGFNSVRTFCRAYKKKFGVPPSQDKMSKNDR